MAGAELPAARAIDGTSILGHLLDGRLVERKRPLYWQYEDSRKYEVFGEGYERRLDNHNDARP